MSSDERPTKQVKLSHDVSGEIVHAAPSTSDIASSQQPGQHESASTPASAPTAQASVRANATGPAAGATTALDSNGTALSKNQLKKLRKKEAWEAGRDWRKAERKRKTKEKKARRREEHNAQTDTNGGDGTGGVNTSNGVNNTNGTTKSKNARGKDRRKRELLPLTLLLDTQFDRFMSDKEIMSLGAQITRCYSDNSKAAFCAHLVVSSWGGRLRERFEGLLRGVHRNWRGVRWEEGHWVEVGREAAVKMRGEKGGKVLGALAKVGGGGEDEGVSTAEEHDAEVNENHAPTTQTPPQPQPDETVANLVYLTSDSPHTLTHLSPHTTYIIGGIVDKNRHKGLCYKVAMDAAKQYNHPRSHTNSTNNGSYTNPNDANSTNTDYDEENMVKVHISTAKLPIGEYMQMSTRQVLATNHVVEIMLKWLEYGDWGRAFVEVVPGRKGGKLRQREVSMDEGLGGEGEGEGVVENEVGGEQDESGDSEDGVGGGGDGDGEEDEGEGENGDDYESVAQIQQEEGGNHEAGVINVDDDDADADGD